MRMKRWFTVYISGHRYATGHYWSSSGLLAWLGRWCTKLGHGFVGVYSPKTMSLVPKRSPTIHVYNSDVRFNWHLTREVGNGKSSESNKASSFQFVGFSQFVSFVLNAFHTYKHNTTHVILLRSSTYYPAVIHLSFWPQWKKSVPGLFFLKEYQNAFRLG